MFQTPSIKMADSQHVFFCDIVDSDALPSTSDLVFQVFRETPWIRPGVGLSPRDAEEVSFGSHLGDKTKQRGACQQQRTCSLDVQYK